MVRLLLLFSLMLVTALIAVEPAEAGKIKGSLNTGAVLNKDLTAEGTADWAIWGYANSGTSTSLTPDVRKMGCMEISDLISIDNGNPLRGLGQYGPFAHSFDWSDGDTVLSESGATGGLQHHGQFGTTSVVGEGFSFTLPADQLTRTVKIYITTHVGESTITASLSDASASPYIQVQGDGSSGNDPGVFTIEYVADSGGQTLAVKIVLTKANEPTNASNLAIFAATLVKDETLGVSSHTISASTGGVIDFSLSASSLNGNRNYILLGSISGSSPGIPLPGGHVVLPLNWDIFTQVVIDFMNTTVFDKFLGVLKSDGTAAAKFKTGPAPGTVGLTMYYAYALASPWDFVSNPVEIVFTP